MNFETHSSLQAPPIPHRPPEESRTGPASPRDDRLTPHPRTGGGWTRKLVMAGLGVVAFGLGYWAHSLQTPSDIESQPTDASSGASADPAAPFWTCSMHPQIRQPGPGKCPICAMDLIPASRGGEEEATGLRELAISREARELLNIQTTPVERRYATATIRMVGKVEYDETRLGYITARVPGRLDRLYVDYTGIEVQKGDHMVYIYSPELYSAQAELIRARQATRDPRRTTTAAASAERLLESAREKLRLWELTAEQIRQIERQDKPSDHLTIYAPMSGVVIERNLKEGAYVDTGTLIYTIADLSQVWVMLDAYESDLNWLRYGQEVEFTTEAYPGEVFVGRIAFRQPFLDPRTRTVKVRVNVPNPEGKLKPEMFVRGMVRAEVASAGRVMDPDLAGRWICRMHPEVVKDQPGDCDVCEMPLVRAESLGYVSAAVVADESAAPLVVPASAALITGRRAVVYVELPDRDRPTYEGREVVLGPRAGDFYLVHSGLEEGERVVTHGNFKLDSALQIVAKPSMMNPETDEAGGDHLHVAPSVAGQLARIQAASREVADATEAGDRETIRTALRSFEEALAAVDAEPLEGQAAMLWKELAMRLRNDAVEGRWAASDTRLRQAVDQLLANMERLRDRFGLTDEAGVLLAGGPFDAPPQFRAQLGRLWQSYLRSQRALADDEPEAARAAVETAQEALAAIETTLLEEDQARQAWMTVHDDFQEAFQQMNRAEDLETLRVGFEAWSLVMTPVLLSFGLEEAAGPVYQLYCSMAFNNRGAAWLQADQDVRNPYFGASMLRCANEVQQIALNDRPEPEGHDHE